MALRRAAARAIASVVSTCPLYSLGPPLLQPLGLSPASCGHPLRLVGGFLAPRLPAWPVAGIAARPLHCNRPLGESAAGGTAAGVPPPEEGSGISSEAASPETLVYESPFAHALWRVKLLSLSSCALTASAAPVLVLLGRSGACLVFLSWRHLSSGGARWTLPSSVFVTDDRGVPFALPSGRVESPFHASPRAGRAPF